MADGGKTAPGAGEQAAGITEARALRFFPCACTLARLAVTAFLLIFLAFLPSCHAQSLGMLELRAVQGDAEAQYQLGEFYLYGVFADRDQKTACRLLSASAKQGHEKAATRYKESCTSGKK